MFLRRISTLLRKKKNNPVFWQTMPILQKKKTNYTLFLAYFRRYHLYNGGNTFPYIVHCSVCMFFFLTGSRSKYPIQAIKLCWSVYPIFYAIPLFYTTFTWPLSLPLFESRLFCLFANSLFFFPIFILFCFFFCSVCYSIFFVVQ